MSDSFIFTYQPEGAEPRSWEIDPNKIKASEYIAVKRVSGGIVDGPLTLGEGLARVDMEVIKALLWMLLKRNMSTLAWDAIDFTLEEVEVEQLTDETPGQLRARLEDARDAGVLTEAGSRRLEVLIASGVEPEREDPKDPASTP